MRRIYFCLSVFVLCGFGIAHAQGKSIPDAALSGEECFKQGIALYQDSKFQDAVQCFEEAAKRKANYSEAYFQAGLCYIKLQNVSKAKQNLMTAKILTQDEELKNKAISLLDNLPNVMEQERARKAEAATQSDTGLVGEVEGVTAEKGAINGSSNAPETQLYRNGYQYTFVVFPDSQRRPAMPGMPGLQENAGVSIRGAIYRLHDIWPNSHYVSPDVKLLKIPLNRWFAPSDLIDTLEWPMAAIDRVQNGLVRTNNVERLFFPFPYYGRNDYDGTSVKEAVSSGNIGAYLGLPNSQIFFINGQFVYWWQMKSQGSCDANIWFDALFSGRIPSLTLNTRDSNGQKLTTVIVADPKVEAITNEKQGDVRIARVPPKTIERTFLNSFGSIRRAPWSVSLMKGGDLMIRSDADELTRITCGGSMMQPAAPQPAMPGMPVKRAKTWDTHNTGVTAGGPYRGTVTPSNTYELNLSPRGDIPGFLAKIRLVEPLFIHSLGDVSISRRVPIVLGWDKTSSDFILVAITGSYDQVRVDYFMKVEDTGQCSIPAEVLQRFSFKEKFSIRLFRFAYTFLEGSEKISPTSYIVSYSVSGNVNGQLAD